MGYNTILLSEFLSKEFEESRRKYGRLNSKERILFWEKAVHKGELEKPETSELGEYNNTFRDAVNDID